ncbi:hypothetical protein BaRGS_00037896, partial [Batillaria attramentaria]
MLLSGSLQCQSPSPVLQLGELTNSELKVLSDSQPVKHSYCLLVGQAGLFLILSGYEECDLETLSALLDDASDEDMADCNHVSDQACPTAENRVCENVASENGDADEADMDTLAAMLEEDSEPEDTHAVALASGGQTDVNADDIAAFFNDASDSEGEIETELPGQQFDSQRKAQNTGCEQNVQSTNKTTSSPVAGGGDEQSDPSHVKKLQDELAMMQQRMMEIQKMLSSQGQTPQSPAAVATPASSNKSEVTTKLDCADKSEGVKVKPDPDGDSGSAMKRHLFGDDSDSDWEDMDGEKPTLSSHGREIKDIMKRGAKERQAHVPNYSPSKLPSVTSTAA